MNTWKLYWVSSDGYEDCFVVAKNSRSATYVEVNINGFDYSDVSTMRITDIPDKFFKKYGQEWPWYAGQDLLKDLGAKFRTIERNTFQILLDGRVYSQSPNGKWTTYLIGFKALCDRNSALPKVNVSEENTADYHEYLYEMMGMAVTWCHRIEWQLSHSFLSVLIKKRKNNNETFQEAFSALDKRTLGSLISSIEQFFDIDIDINITLKIFLDMRNQVIHGITQTERYDIEDNWGQRELMNFLDLFIAIAEQTEKISSAFFEMGLKVMEKTFPDDIDSNFSFDYNDDLLGLFATCFQIKEK